MQKTGALQPFARFCNSPSPLDFQKTLVGITFTTSNKSNSNLFYIRNMQHFTCNEFYCRYMNSSVLIFFNSK